MNIESILGILQYYTKKKKKKEISFLRWRHPPPSSQNKAKNEFNIAHPSHRYQCHDR